MIKLINCWTTGPR